MAKKPKIGTEKQANGQRSEPAPRAIDASSKPKRKKAAPKKKPLHANRKVAPKKASSNSTYEPSDEEIRIRAYFIAERRFQLSLQGDSDHDWIEARRQLVEEANRTAS